MTIDEPVRRVLLSYLNDIHALPNESAKTHRFSALLAALFPGTSISTEFAAGIERLVRIDTASGEKRGRIDAYHGNAIIEFERSLKATGTEAERQLREYTAGLWKKENKSKRQLLCIASDGIIWKTYRPVLKADVGKKITAEDIELNQLRTVEVSEHNLADFWIWLTSFLFRPSHIEPTPRQFKMDFGANSSAFADAMDSLRQAWDIAGREPEPQLALDTWKRYLTVTYGQLGKSDSPDLLSLFLKHTYLASIAKLLVWASLSKGQAEGSLRDIARDILSGTFFQARNIANLVEDDFFQWVRGPQAEDIMAPVWERSLDQMLSYDLSRLSQDVLKEVYQELVDPKDRHDLGEYYTPEWLCDKIVGELLPPKGFVSVLDPTCGSGSFLHAAIVHLLNANRNVEDRSRLRAILEKVAGIDIHPLAVIISKVTYLLAIRSLLKEAKRPIQIPVYLADSLFLPREVSQPRFGEVSGYEIRFGGDRKVSIPERLVHQPDLFDPAIAASAKVALAHAQTGRESQSTLLAYLQQEVPELTRRRDSGPAVQALWSFTSELSDLISSKQNSIWAFVVKNSYRPAMFKDQFQFIVGNPPWLSFRYISDPEYQEEVKKRGVDEYAIAPRSQRLLTQMELATIFLTHTLSTFGREDSLIGFVMPRSIVSADQHENLRLRNYKAPMELYKYWDLLDVHPLFNVPTCVVFARKVQRPPEASNTYSLDTVEWSGLLPARDVSWDEAKDRLSSKQGTARVIYLGERTALSTKPGRTKPSRPSLYAGEFHQGATILPRSFYFVQVKDLKGDLDPERLYWVETDPEQAEEAKKPYKDVFLKGHVEGEFIYSTAISKHVLPFVLLEPAVIVLPAEQSNGRLEIRTAEQLKAKGYREFGSWMEQVERIWTNKRQDKADKQSIYDWLDYSGKLTAQNLNSRYLVLYNAAGTNVSATRVLRDDLKLPFIVEHKLYWFACANSDEADYLAAILNDEGLNEMIKPFQSRGLMGERDIEKKVLDLPIPLFNPNKPEHNQIAELGKKARLEVETFLASTLLPSSLARRRALAREAVSSTMKDIQKLVTKLLQN
jgi:Eco57I restriction-modification methylase